jgi:hypothetical protein
MGIMMVGGFKDSLDGKREKNISFWQPVGQLKRAKIKG